MSKVISTLLAIAVNGNVNVGWGKRPKLNCFYVYTHARPDGSIFYVGKGQGKRAWDFSPARRTKWHRNIAEKYGIKKLVIKVYPAASENDAFKHERQLISDLRSHGIRLINLCDGGEGTSGYSMTAEQRAKHKAAIAMMVISPKWTKSHAAALQRLHSDPEFLAAKTAALKALISDPEFERIRKAAIRKSASQRIAERDAIDPDGAERRADRRKTADRTKARKAGADIPVLKGKQAHAARVAARDTIDPGGASGREKARNAKAETERRKTERIANGLPSDPVAARDVLDPASAKRRFVNRNQHSLRVANRKAGNPANTLMVAAQQKRAKQQIEATDARDPAGAEKRERQRATSARMLARKSGVDIPKRLLGSDLDAVDPDGAYTRGLTRRCIAERKARIEQGLPARATEARDILDPNGAEKRAYQRVMNARLVARKAGLPLPSIPKRPK